LFVARPPTVPRYAGGRDESNDEAHYDHILGCGGCGKHANRQLYHVKVQHITKAEITADWQAFRRPTALTYICGHPALRCMSLFCG